MYKILKKIKYILKYCSFKRELDNLQDLFLVTPALEKKDTKKIIRKAILKNSLLFGIISTLKKKDYQKDNLVRYFMGEYDYTKGLDYEYRI